MIEIAINKKLGMINNCKLGNYENEIGLLILDYGNFLGEEVNLVDKLMDYSVVETLAGVWIFCLGFLAEDVGRRLIHRP